MCEQVRMYYESGIRGRCFICAEQTLHVRSPDGSTLREMTSWPPSWKYDITIWLRQSMRNIALPNFISIRFETTEPYGILWRTRRTTTIKISGDMGSLPDPEMPGAGFTSWLAQQCTDLFATQRQAHRAALSTAQVPYVTVSRIQSVTLFCNKNSRICLSVRWVRCFLCIYWQVCNCIVDTLCTIEVWDRLFLQRVSIACYAERCINYHRFCPTVWPSDRLSVTRWYHAKTTPATIMGSSLEDSSMTLVSSRLTSPRNSKGNIGSEGAEWERGTKHLAKIGNF